MFGKVFFIFFILIWLSKFKVITLILVRDESLYGNLNILYKYFKYLIFGNIYEKIVMVFAISLSSVSIESFSNTSIRLEFDLLLLKYDFTVFQKV